LGQLHQDRLRIRQKQLRGAEIGPTLLLGGRPQSDALSGTLTTSSASALFGARQAAWHSFKALHPGVRVVAELSTQSAVDHKPNGVNRDGAFGNSTGQDHRAVMLRTTTMQGGTLTVEGKLSVKDGNAPTLQRLGITEQSAAAFDLT
jgi:hypothetical protein